MELHLDPLVHVYVELGEQRAVVPVPVLGALTELGEGALEGVVARVGLEAGVAAGGGGESAGECWVLTKVELYTSSQTLGSSAQRNVITEGTITRHYDNLGLLQEAGVETLLMMSLDPGPLLRDTLQDDVLHPGL